MYHSFLSLISNFHSTWWLCIYKICYKDKCKILFCKLSQRFFWLFFYYFLHIIDFQNNKNTLKNIRNQKLFWIILKGGKKIGKIRWTSGYPSRSLSVVSGTYQYKTSADASNEGLGFIFRTTDMVQGDAGLRR